MGFKIMLVNQFPQVAYIGPRYGAYPMETNHSMQTLENYHLSHRILILWIEVEVGTIYKEPPGASLPDFGFLQITPTISNAPVTPSPCVVPPVILH